MMVRTQVMLDAETHRAAKEKASKQGVSMAEYFRRLASNDLATPDRKLDMSSIFDLGSSGGSDVAHRKDEYLADAIAAHKLAR